MNEYDALDALRFMSLNDLAEEIKLIKRYEKDCRQQSEHGILRRLRVRLESQYKRRKISLEL